MSDEVKTENLVVTENYAVWLSHEPDGETVYHVELGQVTVHLFQEEWDELLTLVESAADEQRKQRR